MPSQHPTDFVKPPLGELPKFRQQSCVAFSCELHEIPDVIGKLIEEGWWVEQISHANPTSAYGLATVVAIVGKNADA